MSSERITSLLKAQPFDPFRMMLIDGREFVVDYKAQIAMMPGDTTCIFFQNNGGDSYFTLVSLDAVATIEVKQLPPAVLKHMQQYSD